jgi:hypothetical protein
MTTPSQAVQNLVCSITIRILALGLIFATLTIRELQRQINVLTSRIVAVETIK